MQAAGTAEDEAAGMAADRAASAAQAFGWLPMLPGVAGTAADRVSGMAALAAQTVVGLPKLMRVAGRTADRAASAAHAFEGFPVLTKAVSGVEPVPPGLHVGVRPERDRPLVTSDPY